MPRDWGHLRGKLLNNFQKSATMFMMQLHSVMPQGRELLTLDADITDHGLLFNAVLMGRFRSSDYQAWTRAFRNEVSRWPFTNKSAAEFALDLQAFIHTYVVDRLDRVSDTTLETKRFMRAGRSMQLRNHDLVAILSCNRTELLEAFACKDAKQGATKVMKEVEGVGRFVWKNMSGFLFSGPCLCWGASSLCWAFSESRVP